MHLWYHGITDRLLCLIYFSGTSLFVDLFNGAYVTNIKCHSSSASSNGVSYTTNESRLPSMFYSLLVYRRIKSTSVILTAYEISNSQLCLSLNVEYWILLLSYLRLKFGSTSQASQALEILKQYRHDGQELTLKHFADDDSEGTFKPISWKEKFFPVIVIYCWVHLGISGSFMTYVE